MPMNKKINKTHRRLIKISLFNLLKIRYRCVRINLNMFLNMRVLKIKIKDNYVKEGDSQKWHLMNGLLNIDIIH